MASFVFSRATTYATMDTLMPADTRFFKSLSWLCITAYPEVMRRMNERQ